MPENRAIGYVGVDVLNNATICNEAIGLAGVGLPLEVASVRRFEKPTYYRDESLAELSRRIHTVYPLRVLPTLWALLVAPFLFGRRFWVALARVFIDPVEGWKQRARLAWHFVPAVCLARHWKGRNLGHIHAHWAHTATTVAMHAAELLGIGFSFTGHANDLFVHRVALKAKLRRARFVVCISEYHRRFYLDLGADPERLQVVYCGIDLERFHPPADGVVETYSGSVILGVGRLVEKKGFHDLIQACAELRDRGVECTCVIAGSGPEEGRLRALAHRLQIEGRVTITGRPVLQEDLQPLIHTATVFALPCVRDRDGDMDGLPQVLIEAMACRVPAVSTQLVGIPDLIHDGWNGLLVPPNDTASLADALERLLTNPGWAASLAGNGMDWARLHFSRAKAIQRLKALFEWAADSPGNGTGRIRWRCAPADDGEFPRPNEGANPARRDSAKFLTKA